MKMSRRPGPQEDSAGAELGRPPSGPHPIHWPPVHHTCHIWLSVPRTKASRRSAAQDAAPGLDVRMPPSELHEVLDENGRGSPAVARSRLMSMAARGCLTTRYSPSPLGKVMVIST